MYCWISSSLVGVLRRCAWHFSLPFHPSPCARARLLPSWLLGTPPIAFSTLLSPFVLSGLWWQVWPSLFLLWCSPVASYPVVSPLPFAFCVYILTQYCFLRSTLSGSFLAARLFVSLPVFVQDPIPLAAFSAFFPRPPYFP